MSIFSERFESSSIGAFLEDAIAELEVIDIAELGPDYRDIVVRTKHIVTTVSEQLSGVDPEFLTASLVDELKTSAQHLLEAAQRCKQEGSWNNLTKGGDGLLHFFAQIPKTWHPDKSLKSTNSDLTKYKKDVGKALADANVALEELSKATASVNERAAAIEQCTLESTTDLDIRVGAVSKEIESLEASRAELSEELVQAKEELDELHHATKALFDQLEAEAKEHERARQARLEESLRIQESQWSTLSGEFKSTFTSHINQWSTEANNAANSRQSQFSAELDGFKSLLASLQAEHIRAWEDLAAQWGKTFADLEIEHTRTFLSSSDEASRAYQSLGAECTSKFNDLLEQLKEESDRVMGAYNKRATDLISLMTEKDSQAKEIVGLIGNTAVTGNYQIIANRELSSANWMRGFSIGSVIALVGLALVDIARADPANLGWELMIFRLSVGLPLVGLAWYCGRESSRHRTNEERNRRIELELAALSPFLHQLPKDKAEAIRETLTTKYFGADSDVHPGQGGGAQETIRALLKQLEPLMDILKRLK